MTRTVLCVDDDPDDRELIKNAIADIDPSFEIAFAENGRDALGYLQQATSSELPCLIIMDINMPIMDGKQAIVEIKKRPELSDIPLVVFTTSSHPADLSFCLRYDVELVMKPSSLKQITREAKRLLQHCSEN
jgi:CheY-like chemotaxis protein